MPMFEWLFTYKVFHTFKLLTQGNRVKVGKNVIKYDKAVQSSDSERFKYSLTLICALNTSDIASLYIFKYIVYCNGLYWVEPVSEISSSVFKA